MKLLTMEEKEMLKYVYEASHSGQAILQRGQKDKLNLASSMQRRLLLEMVPHDNGETILILTKKGGLFLRHAHTSSEIK